MLVTTGTYTRAAGISNLFTVMFVTPGTITRVTDGAGKGGYQWSLDNFTARWAAAINDAMNHIYSPPFQHPSIGCRMRLMMNPNGQGDGEDSHVSLFLSVIPSPNDDQLEWPYTLPYKLSIMNHVGGKSSTVVFDTITTGGIRYWQKPVANPNLGHAQFIKHTDLSPYLLNDKMTINITNLQKG